MKRILAAMAAVLIVGAIIAVAGGATAGAATSQRTSIGVVGGHYEGRDAHGNHIRFKVPHDGDLRVSTFRVNHTEFGHAPIGVHDNKAYFTHDCNKQHMCAQGHWTNIDQVSGAYRWHSQQRAISYTAHWVESWSGN